MTRSALAVGLVGLGAVGRTVAEMVARGDAPGVTVAAALVRDVSRHHGVGAIRIFDDPAAFLEVGSDLVVEAAGQRAVGELGVRMLASGRDLMVVSGGALADAALLSRLREAAATTSRRIFVPSGSIGALDAIASAALGGITEITHTIRKPPRAFTAEQLGDREGVQTVFEGAVREGAARFPENANAATAVGLAGIGPERTRLRIVSDPGLTRNVQEIDVTGEFGHLRFQIENVPSANPKTSRLVALSVVRALRVLTTDFVVGV